MNPNDYDIKGRAVIQHFYSELEKIAYSSRAVKMLSAAAKAQANVPKAGKTLGARRFVPFTQEHRAYFGHVGQKGSGVKGRARDLANKAESQASKERASMLSAVEKGKGNQGKILDKLKAGPQSLGPGRRAKRAVGLTVPVEEVKNQPKGMSPAARKAALAGGGIAAGASGLYAGQKYLENKSQQGGYGGY